ncbi:MAG: glutathione peroxidase [Saprospiraceae bacterium]|nr:glutathione peroxidase [Saprospiraceae bacterium]
MQASLYDIKIKTLAGISLNLADFRGKKIMIVNVASQCGYTNQYEQLQHLYEDNIQNLVILGCPCNDFGGQEAGDAVTIYEFCKLNYGVSFPLTEKIGIKSNIHPLYQWLTDSTLNGKSNHEVLWNFYKFLIDEEGSLVKCLNSASEPISDEVTDWLKN